MTAKKSLFKELGLNLDPMIIKKGFGLHQIGDKQWDHRRKKKKSNIVSSSWGGREYRNLPSSTARWSSNMLQTEGGNTTSRPKNLLWAPGKFLTAALQLPPPRLCEPPAETPRPLIPARKTTPELPRLCRTRLLLLSTPTSGSHILSDLQNKIPQKVLFLI